MNKLLQQFDGLPHKHYEGECPLSGVYVTDILGVGPVSISGAASAATTGICTESVKPEGICLTFIT
jgi:hypothetical protein